MLYLFFEVFFAYFCNFFAKCCDSANYEMLKFRVFLPINEYLPHFGHFMEK